MTWEIDADEVGKDERHGSWRSALRIARSVEPGLGEGGGGTDGSHRPARAGERVSGGEFAARARIGRETVWRYWRAWRRAAEAGLVPTAEQLGPDDEPDLPERERWDEFFGGAADRAEVERLDRAHLATDPEALPSSRTIQAATGIPNTVVGRVRAAGDYDPGHVRTADGKVSPSRKLHLVATPAPPDGRRKAAVKAERIALDAADGLRGIRPADVDDDVMAALHAVMVQYVRLDRALKKAGRRGLEVSAAGMVGTSLR